MVKVEIMFEFAFKNRCFNIQLSFINYFSKFPEMDYENLLLINDTVHVTAVTRNP